MTNRLDRRVARLETQRAAAAPLTYRQIVLQPWDREPQLPDEPGIGWIVRRMVAAWEGRPVPYEQTGIPPWEDEPSSTNWRLWRATGGVRPQAPEAA